MDGKLALPYCLHCNFKPLNVNVKHLTLVAINVMWLACSWCTTQSWWISPEAEISLFFGYSSTRLKWICTRWIGRKLGTDSDGDKTNYRHVLCYLKTVLHGIQCCEKAAGAAEKHVIVVQEQPLWWTMCQTQITSFISRMFNSFLWNTYCCKICFTKVQDGIN